MQSQATTLYNEVLWNGFAASRGYPALDKLGARIRDKISNAFAQSAMSLFDQE